jgi:hypothetical protein
MVSEMMDDYLPFIIYHSPFTIYFGLKAFIFSSLQTKKGPPIKSMQYGMAGKTASRHCLIALGFPGRFRINV